MTDLNKGDTYNGNGTLPWQVRAIAYLGFPIVVALFFLGQIAGWIPSAVDQHSRQQAADMLVVHQHLIDIKRAQEAQDTAMREHRIRQEDLIRMLATGLNVICENSAKSQYERNNCANIKASARYVSP